MKNINTRLKMALLLQSQESGFAIVIAVSLGLIMILVGLTMTLRSQGDQVISSTQKQTDEALAAAEKGIAFYKDFFNSSSSNRQLVKYPDCTTRNVGDAPGTACTDPASTTNVSQMSWSNLQNIPALRSACNTTNLDNVRNVYASTDWKDANDPFDTDPNVSSSQQFRLVKYYAQSAPASSIIRQLGTLVVEGRMTPDNNDNINKSISRLKVTFPIRDGDIFGLPVPGVWVGGTSDADGTANNKIAGDILINNCNISGTDKARIESNLRAKDDGSMPMANITEMQMPTVPAAPSVRRIGTPANAPSSTNPFNPNSDRAGHIPLAAISGNTTITLPDESANYSINPPKVPDSRFKMTSWAGATDVYVYKVPSITGGNITIKIKPNTKVMLYLDGEITNNVSIICETSGACNPMDTMIFGTSTATAPKICINGSNSIEAFVFAPNYRVGVASGTPNPVNGISNFLGAVWSKEWGGPQCGSTGPASDNSGFVAVRQRGTWNNLPTAVTGQIQQQYPPEVDATGSWERRDLNNNDL